MAYLLLYPLQLLIRETAEIFLPETRARYNHNKICKKREERKIN